MPGRTLLRMYGENAATFLMFHALTACNNAVQEVLLRRLKRFGSGRTKKWPAAQNIQVWLFPNFGKAHGFGEPDAVILADENVFWVEVETIVDFQFEKTASKHSVLQLWRFHLLQQALSQGVKEHESARRIMGETIQVKKKEKLLRKASVRVGGHGMLKDRDIRGALISAGKEGSDHYVLLTVDKPKGEGAKVQSYSKTLERETHELGSCCPEHLSRLPVERCWYAYWKGDLAPAYEKLCGSQLLLDGVDSKYVRIRRSG